MQKRQHYDNVLTVTNLVAAGDPKKKARSKTQNSNSSHLDDLNQRIDEIEDAIGQDNSGPVGRAFAIRAETNKLTRSSPAYMTDADIQKAR